MLPTLLNKTTSFSKAITFIDTILGNLTTQPTMSEDLRMLLILKQSTAT